VTKSETKHFKRAANLMISSKNFQKLTYLGWKKQQFFNRSLKVC
jgi:hypothetical protein